MKLATYEIKTPVGPFQRIAAVMPGSELIDLNFAYAALLADRGMARATERANWILPPEMLQFAEQGTEGMDAAREALEFVTGKVEPTGPRGEQVIYTRNEVRLLPPVLRPPVLRDFAAFEEHLQITFGKMGLKIPPAWYEQPIAFKGNPTSLYGPDTEVIWPRYTQKLDYEMEICAVIGKAGQNIPVDKVQEHIFGWTILNDFSARDIQKKEMSVSTGPYKGKDFAWGLGPWIVTADEIGDPAALQMSVRVNGETWAESTPRTMKWNFSQIISYTSQDERLNIGDLFGSGTVDGGCGFEIDRWLQPGDFLEVEIEKIGILSHRIGHPAVEPLNWKG